MKTPHTDVEAVQALEDKELDELASQLPLMETWIEAVKLEIQRRLLLGRTFAYAAMRDKQATRKWSDGIDIIEVLTNYLPLEDAAPRVPLTPAKAEKILGKAKFESLTQYVLRESSGQVMGFTNPGKAIFID